MIDKFDVVIVGGGMIGQTCALALAEAKVKVALVAPELNAPISQTQALRVSAINQASINAFNQLGVWDLIQPSAKAPFEQMQVWDKDSAASIEFSSQDNHADALGYIVENAQIEKALTQLLSEHAHCELYQTRVIQVNQDASQALVQLESGQFLQASLLVVADGAESKLRQNLDIPLTFSDYGQKAIVAKIKTEYPHQNIARQVFTPSGPLAFLPLANPNEISIVWSQDSDKADELLALSEQAFSKKLAACFDCVLGQVELLSERLSFSLKMRYAQTFITGSAILIGDAAHTIHPLAGQGANLGLMDALAVAEAVQSSLALSDEINLTLLKQTMRWRQAEAMQRIIAMQAFKQGFGTDFLPVKQLRGLALNFADKAPLLKQKLAALAMGTSGKLPKLAQAEL
ncbi:UbiH/UbiF/VisC/COQ6 family ubiquinone biosynthesis hydroxylase [Catenovulum sp. 2E275]|uniref:UbiH/UbiF/VisC/COQ6 family ubiquinone biosynthesis hydroxylase n=1 Tax=Catenovulum sp. 2E275 TaxID=2980497 RepID=UPI0021D161EB|nr:UbiH/UbiF/VisC/COQ6 family ubiquinone biosynthesis hydroxylase [Catenovulum sp. 2E275]MCU4674320.1 UbiH/UbiF/VisC/COQ6 family ubiquinone biosynthesis hydroxylase [Catenovulum sp. 2E275]